jgi:membrane AbrB-like protein
MSHWGDYEPFRKAPRAAQWGLLLLLSALLVALLMSVHLPAALLLGAMLAGVLLETGGASVRIPGWLYRFSQAVIGCLIARVITIRILKTFAVHWPLFLGVMLTVIAGASALGWLLNRLRLFSDTTAIWGLLPGAASVMMIMAEDFGADGRLVAFMQYLRVVFVAVAAAIVARVFHASSHFAPIVWFPPIHGLAFLETLLFIGSSLILAKICKIRAGGILVPMILGAVLNVTGGLTLDLPQWFLAASFALLGWTIGLRFTRAILRHAARTLPQTVLSVVLLMALCWGMSWVLVRLNGVDPLTAYLATSPGGMDAATVIAASCNVDMPFVVSMQAARLFMVLLIGPILSRWVAGRVVGDPATRHAGAPSIARHKLSPPRAGPGNARRFRS